jgi:SPP1 gp7 family putative phage head morphogenesis protein
MTDKKQKAFRQSVSAETTFARSLRKVARHAGHIVGVHIDGVEIIDEPGMQKALRDYSKLIDPWARRQAAKMLEAVSRKNRAAYQKHSKELGRLLKTQVAQSQVGEKATQLLNDQVTLIKTIPLRAGERAQELAMKAALSGTRASEVAEALKNTTQVSENDAVRIARTEVAKATASINQARAEAVGSRQYRWRNSGDEAVRDSHKFYKGKKLDGHVFDWDSPPTLDDGMTGNPGNFPNCRCYAEPVFDEE